MKEILHDPIDREMVRSINEIGHLTGKQTIAEFAENAEIITMLRGMGIDYAQGYGVSEPKRLLQQPMTRMLTHDLASARRRSPSFCAASSVSRELAARRGRPHAAAGISRDDCSLLLTAATGQGRQGHHLAFGEAGHCARADLLAEGAELKDGCWGKRLMTSRMPRQPLWFADARSR